MRYASLGHSGIRRQCCARRQTLGVVRGAKRVLRRHPPARPARDLTRRFNVHPGVSTMSDSLVGTSVRGADGILYRVSSKSCEPIVVRNNESPTVDSAKPFRSSARGSDHAAARQVIDPGDGFSARQVIDPGDGFSARQVIDPGDGHSARQVIDPGDGHSARQMINPG